jgi:UDP-N-acetylglucosamine/UDP-N-acetylgalactosamine diphosphorylase
MLCQHQRTSCHVRPALQGCFDIGLPSAKSLFKLQAERILKLQQLATATPQEACPAQRGMANTASTTAPKVGKLILWYVMTSSATHSATESFFDQEACFGLRRDQVVFFTQGTLPCLTETGHAIVAEDGSVSLPPLQCCVQARRWRQAEGRAGVLCACNAYAFVSSYPHVHG